MDRSQGGQADPNKSHHRPLGPGDPRRLGRYALRQILGEGGFGRVYLGTDPAGREVAVKVLQAKLAAEREFVERFRQEARNARRVARMYTAQVLDFDADNDPPYLVTEFVQGLTLAQRISSSGPMAGSELDQLAYITAAALEAIHQAHMVHRDFKPANVMLSPTGPRVIDFGIAKVADPYVGAAHGLTMIGTPGFSAPEQLDGLGATDRSDIYAWAATIAVAGTGRLPFAGRSHEIVHDRPDLAGLEEPLRTIVAEGLRRNPRERPTARQVMERITGTGRRQASQRPADQRGTTRRPSGDAAADRGREIDQEILWRMGL